MKKVTEDKFERFHGSISEVISYSFLRKAQLLGKLFFEDMDPITYKGVLTERKFWSETHERMKEIKKTS